MGTFINSVRPFTDQCTNECQKLATNVAEISVNGVRVKDKISIFGDATISR